MTAKGAFQNALVKSVQIPVESQSAFMVRSANAKFVSQKLGMTFFERER